MNLNNYGLELDRIRTKNLLFTGLANSVVNEELSQLLRERVEPLIAALEVVATICGVQSSTKEVRAALKTSMIDDNLYGLSFSAGKFPIRAGVADNLLSSFNQIHVNYGLYLIQDTTPSPTAALLDDALITNLPFMYMTVHPVETLLFGNTANQFALPSRFKYLTAKRLAYLASLPKPPPQPGVNLSVPFWSIVGGSVPYPTAVLEWMVRVANPFLYTTTPPPVLSEDEQKRQQEITAQVLDADAKLYWTYNASYMSAPEMPVTLFMANASSCSNAAVNSQGVVVGQLAGDCVSLSLSDAVNVRNPIEVCWPIDFHHPMQVVNHTLTKFDVGKVVKAARIILQTDAKSGIAVPHDIYGLMRVGNSWVEPLGRRVEIRGAKFCSHYLVGEDDVICPIRRTENIATFPEIFSDKTIALSSSCNFIEPFLDAVQSEHKIVHDTRSYTPLASQQQANFDRHHDGIDTPVPEIKNEFIFIDGPEYQPRYASGCSSFEIPFRLFLILATIFLIN
jgi:hypothetical protein